MHSNTERDKEVIIFAMGSEGKTQEQSLVSRKNTPITPPPHHPIPIGLKTITMENY
jgi:hypothetical protein